MKLTRSLIGLSIATCALILTGCVSSTKHAISPMVTAKVSPHLMIPPPELPPIQASNEGMDGGQCVATLASTYDIAGQIRAAFIGLQAEVKTIEKGEPKK